VIGDEARVTAAFCAWLEDNGWTVRREVDFVDVVAERAGERLYAEAKGTTKSAGTDLDTLYGQLLRRMTGEIGTARYGVVVPSSAVTAALRVPEQVRQQLQVEVYEVTDDNRVVRR
jgi:hypothetical protein